MRYLLHFFCLFLFISNTLQGQYYYSGDEKNVVVQVYGGISNRTTDIQANPVTQPSEAAAQDAQLKGTMVGGKAVYFINHSFHALGLKSSYFWTKEETFTRISVQNSSKQNVFYIGPVYEFGFLSANQYHYAFFNASAGYASFSHIDTNVASGKENYKITNTGIAYDLGVGYTFFIAKKYGIGVTFNYLFGELKNYEISNPNQINLDVDFNRVMNRYDIGLGLSYIF